jgi:hypothetical protein
MLARIQALSEECESKVLEFMQLNRKDPRVMRAWREYCKRLEASVKGL